jgi:uncharacterized coiled-coil DUF342 family protein
MGYSINMKTRHFIYLTLFLVSLASLIFFADYRKKYLEINSQYETVSSQYKELNKKYQDLQNKLSKEVKYQQDLREYSLKVKQSYELLSQSFTSISKELEQTKSAPKPQPKVVYVDKVKTIERQIASVQENPKIDKLLSLLSDGQSQIDSLNQKIEELSNKCSQPVVKIIERPVVERVPASAPQVETKKSQNKPIDKFF